MTLAQENQQNATQAPTDRLIIPSSRPLPEVWARRNQITATRKGNQWPIHNSTQLSWSMSNEITGQLNLCQLSS
jgi:hypothetical protein